MLKFRVFSCVAAAMLFSFAFVGCSPKMDDSGDAVSHDPIESLPGDNDETKFGDPADSSFKDGADDNSLEPTGVDGLVRYKKNLNLPTIYFAYNSENLVSSEKAKLDKVAAFLNKNTVLFLIVEGHCDQRGTEEYNRALGERRANTIRQYLAGAGVDDSRLRTISYGKDRPKVEGGDESAWGRNRRGELVPALKKN